MKFNPLDLIHTNIKFTLSSKPVNSFVEVSQAVRLMLSSQSTDIRAVHILHSGQNFVILNTMVKNNIYSDPDVLVEVVPLQGNFKLGIVGTTIGFKFVFEMLDRVKFTEEYWGQEFPDTLREACDLISLIPIHSN